ncbi:hypothetical protein C4553_02280 [Candidatus Parcubacteria bacterium]|nr:MAG: hypothetical protein C4553_02280 [Candidatus Parcubacteria bacterium]
MKKVIIAYIPALHAGYLKLFENHRDAQALYILGPELIQGFDWLRKDIRALDPQLVAQAISSWGLFSNVSVVDKAALAKVGSQSELFSSEPICIVMPDEDVCRELAQNHLQGHKIEFDSIFLRWDKQRVLAREEIVFDDSILADEFIRDVFGIALSEAKKSPDWWRQVGGVLVKDGEVIFAGFNRHTPSANAVLAFGDPRANFKKGLHFELSSALHVEAAMVARAAKEGISLEGADLFVTTFPCPPCARVVAYSGIKRVYYLEGYSIFDAAQLLKECGVKIVHVQMKSPPA